MTKRIQVYETPDIVVTFDPNVCRHTGVCIRGLPDVFDVKRRKWVRPELAGALEVAAQVGRCPSGALQCRLKHLPSIDVGLREVREGDIPVFFEYQRDPAANRMAAYPAREHEAFVTHWANIFGDDRIVKRTVVADGEVAGNVVSFDRNGRREVGYWIGRKYWGRGIASRALADFLEIERVRPLYASVVADNVASIRVLAKRGFTELRREKAFSKERGVEIEEMMMVLNAPGAGGQPDTRPR